MPTKEYLDRVAHERAAARRSSRREPGHGDAFSRRRFLELGASAGVAFGLPWQACSPKHPQSTGGPRIAVIGAGIAGLTCAYRLGEAGLQAKVFDSWNRVGGRMFTARGMWADDQLIELGGELIDTEHEALRGLAEDLGLTLDPILEPAGSGIRQDTWFFGGRAVLDDEIVEAFRPVAERMAMDVAAEDDEAEFARIDELGLAAYLDSIPELGGFLRPLIEVAYVGEYGREIAEQSPWNLLWLIDSETPDPFRIYGDSDEAFHVKGGNDQITTGLADELTSPIELEHRLVRIAEKAGGAFTLSFDRGTQSAHEEDFDRVVFALPFTRLRDVEMSAALLPEDKVTMIRELGMGTNAKLMGQFSEQVWRTQHQASGSVTTDNGLQMLWETSRGQAGASGILTVFAGGTVGEQIGSGTAESQMQARLAQIDQIFPGTAATYIADSAARMHWPTVEHTQGSYTCYLPGQASYSGTEGERVGNLHFCGEHTSEDFQGYMNGGAESGERVAAELLEQLGVEKRQGRLGRRARSFG
jgi:monoamine oxidase